MKKIMAEFLSNVISTFSRMTVKTACPYITYSPEVPEELKK